MPFKVVSTIEKGKPVLSAVPSGWEKDGILFWPRLPSIKINKLRRMENSEPDGDWQVLDCFVKRTYLSTFESAELEIESVCLNSETETDNEKENRTVSNQRPRSFEKIVEECLNDTNHKNISNPIEAIEIQHQLQTQINSVSEDLQEVHASIPIDDNFLMNNEILTKINDLKEQIVTVQNNQGVLQENINVVLENQKMLFEGQQTMMLNISAIATQFEEFMKKSSRVTNNTENVDFQLIKNNEELSKLELLLNDSNKQTEYSKKLSTVCGKGKGRGINNAYALIDAMFDRQFLKTCSWAGGSRSTERKICFKSFTNVIKLFFNIVYDSDNCFTINECHTFFKNVLKNSSQRCSSKKLRTSATKNRPKTNKKNKVGTSTTTTSKSTTAAISISEANTVTNKSHVVNSATSIPEANTVINKSHVVNSATSNSEANTVTNKSHVVNSATSNSEANTVTSKSHVVNLDVAEIFV